MSRVRSAAAALLVLLADPLGAQRPVTTEVRDSGGIIIVTNRGDAPPERWVLAAPARFTLRAGQDDVTHAARVGDGFVVAHRQRRQLRWYDAQGAFVRGAGRRGTGPGEFQYLTHMQRMPGDSIAAWDLGADRLSIFSPAGGFVRAVNFRVPEGLTLFPEGVLPDGSLVASHVERNPPPGTRAGDVLRPPRVLLRVHPRGRVDTLLTVPDTERYARMWDARRDTEPYLASVPLGRTSFVQVTDSAFYAATGERYEIARYGLDGTLQRMVRREVEPIPLRERDGADFTRIVLESMWNEPESARRREAAILQQAPLPATFAAFTSMMLDTDGRLWVRETDPPSRWRDGSRWSVFDAEGRWIAAVQGPAYFYPLQIGPDWVLGREGNGARDVIRLYGIQRTAE